MCNHVTGQCDEGCAAGWRGRECNIGIRSYHFDISVNLIFTLQRFSEEKYLIRLSVQNVN